jgi:hypothetical protein
VHKGHTAAGLSKVNTALAKRQTDGACL